MKIFSTSKLATAFIIRTYSKCVSINYNCRHDTSLSISLLYNVFNKFRTIDKNICVLILNIPYWNSGYIWEALYLSKYNAPYKHNYGTAFA